MGIIDIIAIVGLVLALLLGAKKGVLHEILILLLVVATFFIAHFLHPMLMEIAERFTPVDMNKSRIIFLITFFVVFSLGSMIFSGLISKVSRFEDINPVSRILGGIIGLAKGALYVGMLMWFIASVAPKNIAEQVHGGLVAKHTVAVVSVVYDKMEQIIREHSITPFTIMNYKVDI